MRANTRGYWEASFPLSMAWLQGEGFYLERELDGQAFWYKDMGGPERIMCAFDEDGLDEPPPLWISDEHCMTMNSSTDYLENPRDETVLAFLIANTQRVEDATRKATFLIVT